MLRCSCCRQTKPLSEFNKNKALRTGYSNQCKVCLKAYYTSEKNLRNRKARRDSDWSRALATEVRSRAKKAGLPCSIDASDLQIPLLCPVLGIPLFRVAGKYCDNSPSVDRIFPDLGYVKGNVAVISWKANRIKSDCGDPKVFEAIASYIRNSRRPKAVAA